MSIGLAATRRVPARRVDDRGRDRRGQRHPRAGDRGEVRPARQAHRGRRRARERHGRRGRVPSARPARPRPGRDRRRPLLRLDVEGLSRLAGGAVDRAPARLRRRLRARVLERLVRDARRAAARAELPARGAGAAQRPARRRVPRVAPDRLRQRALALHVQLRRRRRRGPPDARRAARAARRACDHRRLVRAPGEGARGRLRRARLGGKRRGAAPLPRRRRPGRR